MHSAAKNALLTAALLSGGLGSGIAADKTILLIAGRPSHGPGDHEFLAGSLLLQKCLNKVKGIKAEVHDFGWPKNDAAFESIDAVLIYADGGGSHPAIQKDRAKLIDGLAKKGIGIGCAHYGVEVPKGDPAKPVQESVRPIYKTLRCCPSDLGRMRYPLVAHDGHQQAPGQRDRR